MRFFLAITFIVSVNWNGSTTGSQCIKSDANSYVGHITQNIIVSDTETLKSVIDSTRNQSISTVFKGTCCKQAVEMRQQLAKLGAEARGYKKKIKELENSLKGMSIACPANFQKYAQHCYHFATDELTWQAARVKCKSKSADLVWIESAEENSYVKNTFVKLGLDRQGILKGVLYLGATHEAGTWKWAHNGKSIDGAFANWFQRRTPNGNKKYAIFYIPRDGWAASPGNFAAHYICKI